MVHYIALYSVGAHPRIGGEHLVLAIGTEVSTGSPPHRRGTPLSTPPVACADGLTPA